MLPGDLIGFETKGFFALLIRLGQRVKGVKHWHITHVAVVEHVYPNGSVSIIQAVRKINRVLLASYGGTPRVVIPSPVLTVGPEREAGVLFAQSCLGQKYGIFSVISRGLNCITPKVIQVDADRAGRMDCACLAVRVLEHEGVIVPVNDPWQTFPGSLVDIYGTEAR